MILFFGLSNDSDSFQFYINYALRGYLNDFCTIYMNDILIYSENLENYRRHVRLILQRLRKCDLQVNISKCEFEQQEIKDLGLLIDIKGIRMNPQKIEVVVK